MIAISCQRSRRPVAAAPVVALLALLALLALVALVAACERAPRPVATPPPLDDIPGPAIDAFEPEVREQLEQARRRVVALLEPGAPAPEPGPLAEALGELARHYHAYEMTAPAIVLYRLAAERAPGEFRWPYLLGAALHREGDLVAARAAYERAAGLREEYAPAHVRLGAVLLELGETGAALPHLERAARLAPGDAAVHETLGRGLAQAGRHDEAVGAFERALSLAPDAASVHRGLGASLRELGRDDEAREHLERAWPGGVTLDDPAFAELSTLLRGAGSRLTAAGRAMSRGEWEAAEAIYRSLLADDTAHVEARLGLGLALVRLERIDDAVREYRAAARVAPQNVVVHHNLATLLARTGQTEDAILQFRRALSIEPGNRDARAGLAGALSAAGRTDDALAEWDVLLEANPTDAFALGEATRLLFDAGRAREAVARLERASAASPDDGLTRLTLGLARAQAGDVDGALAEFRAVSESGAEPAVRARAEHGIARVLVLKRQPAEAERHYRGALGLDPVLAEARHELAELLAASGRAEDALAELGPLLDERPGFAPAVLRAADLLTGMGRHAEARDVLARGAAEGGAGPAVTLALARVLLSSPDATVRDPSRALDLASALAEQAPAPEVTETIARALAHLGRFDEAVRTQDELIAAVEGRVPAALLAKLRADRGRYERGELPSDP